MAGTDRELRVKDGFSAALDRYVKKIQLGISAEARAQNSLDDLMRKRDEAQKKLDELAATGRDAIYGAGSLPQGWNEQFAAAGESLNSLKAQVENAEAEIEKLSNQKITLADRFEVLKEDAAGAANGIKNFVSNLLGMNKATPALDGVTKRIRGMVLYMFTARRLLRYMRDSIQYAPDDVAKPLQGLKSSISGLFNGTMVSALAGLSGGVERLNKAFQSESGQKFARGIETIARFAGGVMSYAFEKAALLVEWLGDHFEIAAGIAAVMAARTAAKFALMGASFALAHLHLLLIIGAIGLAGAAVNALVKHFTGAALKVEDVFGFIGQGVGWLYALGYNAVADIWNYIAAFVEFFGNVWDDPVAAIGHLFIDLFDTIVGVVESAAKAISVFLGTDYSTGISDFRDKIQAYADDQFGVKTFTVERMTKLDNADITERFGNKGRDLANSLSDFSLKNATAQELKKISDNTSSIAKAVTEEDLKAIVDLAERQFVSNVNLTSQTPVINITGANTGNTAADRKSLADALAKVLTEMAASSGSISGAAYSEG